MGQKNTIGGRLRALRQHRGLNQTEVAVAVGISRAHLAKIETGGDNPGRHTLGAFATYFGVTMDYLENGAEPPRAQPPDDSVYSEDDRAWVRLGRELDEDPARRDAVLRFLRQMAQLRPPPPKGRRRSK